MSTNSASGRLYDIPFLENDGSNFQTWKYRISMVLDIRGLWPIVEGTEGCPPEGTTAEEKKAQDPLIEKWVSRDKEARAQITLTLRDEPLSGVILSPTAAEIWDKLKQRYEGKGQYIVAQLIGEIFRGTFTEDIPLEQQFNMMCFKVHLLKSLGHELADSLIATAMIVSLPESYATL